MKPITTDKQHARLLKRIERWMDLAEQKPLNHQQTKRLVEMSRVCAIYERIRYPLAPLTPKQEAAMQAAKERAK